MALPVTYYPQPRSDRGSKTQPARPPVVTVKTPRVNYFPFNLLIGLANSRSSTSTRRLSGPAVIRQFQFATDSSSDPPQQSIELGISPVPVNESIVPLTTPKSWNQLGERLDHPGFPLAAGVNGFLVWSVLDAQQRRNQPLDLHIVIPDESFYLVVSAVNGAGVPAGRIIGHVVVAENINAAAYERYY